MLQVETYTTLIIKQKSKAMNKLSKPKQAEVVIQLKALVYTRLEIDKKIEKLEAKLKPLKEAKQGVNQSIMDEFKRRDEYSSRIEGATVSLSVRKTAVVVDEAKVIEQLKKDGLEEYVSESINDLFEGAKKQMAQGNLPLLEGIEIRETEFISIRPNEKDEPRKVVNHDFKRIERS
jgi:hypothetical protein